MFFLSVEKSLSASKVSLNYFLLVSLYITVFYFLSFFSKSSVLSFISFSLNELIFSDFPN